MGRNANGPQVFLRGEVWNARWADGRGGAIRCRLQDEAGSIVRLPQTKLEALHHAWRLYTDWSSARRTFAPGAQKPDSSLGSLTAQYVAAHERSWSTSTLRKYLQHLNVLEKFFDAGCRVGAIGFPEAEAFRLFLQKESGLSDSAINHTIEFCRSVFAYGEKLGSCSVNPFRFTKLLKVHAVRPADPFTPDEVRALLNVARLEYPLFYPLLLVGAIIGARRSELCAFNVRDFDARLGTLTISQRKNSVRPYAFKLPASVRTVIEPLVDGREENEPLFCNDAGKRYSPNSLDAKCNPPKQHPGIWRRLLESAEVRPRGIHNLRSAVVTNLVDAGFSLDQTTAVVANTPEVARRHYLVTKKLNQTSQLEALISLYGVDDPTGGSG